MVHSFIHLSMCRKLSKLQEFSNLFGELKPHLKIIEVAKILSQKTTLFTFSTVDNFHLSAASQSTSSRSSRSSTLGSGLSTRSATTTRSDGEIEALDNVQVVARWVN